MNLKELYGWIISKILYDWNPRKKKAKLSFYKELVSENDLVLDIGAHLGDRTDTFLKLGAKVIAIEPQPRFYNHLNKKFSGNSNVTIIDSAVSSTLGQTQLKISSKYPTLSSIADDNWLNKLKNSTVLDVEYDKVVNVEMTTIDKLSEEFGDFSFIKIDVEGHELDVLNGMTKSCPAVSFEFLSFSFDRLESCLKYLEKLGYNSFNWSKGESFKFNLDKHVDSINELYKSIINFPSSKTFAGDVYAWKINK